VSTYPFVIFFNQEKVLRTCFIQSELSMSYALFGHFIPFLVLDTCFLGFFLVFNTGFILSRAN
jgi:hypothetical protein